MEALQQRRGNNDSNSNSNSDGSIQHTINRTFPSTKSKAEGNVSAESSQKRLNAILSILMVLAFFTLASYSSRGSPDTIATEELLKVSRMETRTTQHNTKVWQEPTLPPNWTLEQLQAHPTLPPARSLKVPYPIFVASFSKSGTTSTFTAFACHLGADYVAHRWTSDANKKRGPELIGRCVEQNVLRRQAPFQGCGTNYFNRTQTVVWTDTSYIGGDDGCYNPNLQALDAIEEAYPQATLLLVRRNATAWYQSANSRRAAFIRKWASKCPEMPNTRKQDVWVDFYQNYTQRVREFAKSHPRMTYVEIELEDPTAGQILEAQMGLPASCWKQCPSSFAGKGCTELNATKKNDDSKSNHRRLKQVDMQGSFAVSWH